jgi:hypothetical protein
MDGSEFWAFSKRVENTFEVLETKILRNVIG